ncbi:MAG: undecaprenyl-diphosphate phosphatase [Faecalicatena sp.]|uniref:undecaprenyl-diphosphate phosphatase n=1 Tax=Faecalicatena sp. TaxID=2005360 RepID=UPI00258E6E8B|nr:undecaprenyl-diphosphate phosphatase [Faecalicatena sp.]MCI6466509.1 undecaprenyl-diphosphate phosphatase [Faecalicatena sp.]MDY5617884.1 undecaprenyl-diphosphate phosphatase [Lachnospiraceae bacterium]
MLEALKVIVLGIVEGITEWLPISSTGHLILVEEFIKLDMSDSFVSMFNVVIQLGAIMAVVLIYFHKLNPFSPKKTEKQKLLTLQLWVKVLIASVPAAIIGLLFDDFIDAHLMNYVVVAITLILYGVAFIVVEKRHENAKPAVKRLSDLTIPMVLVIGCFQVLALIPGTSRSGATIIGGLLIGAARGVAAEFTFFLAIPVMFGASFLKIIKFGFHFTGMEVFLLLLGCVISFAVSVFAIKFLMQYIKNHDFKAFGYYRIVLGIIVLLYFGMTAMFAA